MRHNASVIGMDITAFLFQVYYKLRVGFRYFVTSIAAFYQSTYVYDHSLQRRTRSTADAVKRPSPVNLLRAAVTGIGENTQM